MENSVSHNPEDVQAAFATYLAEKGVNINSSSSSSSSNASNNNNNDEVSMNQVIPPAFGNVEKDKDEKLICWKTDNLPSQDVSGGGKVDPNDPEGVL